MEQNYILSYEDTIMSINYINNKIVQTIYENNVFGSSQVIIADVLSKFTATIFDNTVYLFCQNLTGDIVLCVYKDNKWDSKIILNNNGAKVNTILFYPLINEKGMTIIYNTASQEINSGYLKMQKLDAKGENSRPITIDKFIPIKNTMFRVDYISHDHVLVFYQNKETHKNLGYVEIFDNKVSTYNVFHSTNYQIIDITTLTLKDAIYIAYVVKSSFSSQIIFRKKTGATFSNPLTISEGSLLDNTVLMYNKSTLYIFFSSGSSYYYQTSNDDGLTFSNTVKCKNRQPLELLKISSKINSIENTFAVSNLYVTKKTPNQIRILTDFVPEIYPNEIEVKKIQKLEKIEEQQKIDLPVNTLKSEIAELKEKIMILNNKVAFGEKQNVEKDKKILALSLQHKKYSDELIDLSNKNSKLIDENKQLMKNFQTVETMINIEENQKNEYEN